MTASRTYLYMIALFTLVFVITEVVLVYVSIVLGAAIHAILVGGLLLQYISAPASGEQPSRIRSPIAVSSILLPVLAQLSILRLMSLVIPIQQIPEMYWYPLVGLPVLIGAAATARAIGLTLPDLRLTRRFEAPEIAIAASGVPLGLIGYLIVRPDVDVDADAWVTIVATAVFLMVFSGFLEELLFRGLLQNVAARELGNLAIPWSGLLFGVMYLATQSIPYALFMGACGLFFGWCYARRSSLLSISVAHAILSTGLLIVFPLLLND